MAKRRRWYTALTLRQVVREAGELQGDGDAIYRALCDAQERLVRRFGSHYEQVEEIDPTRLIDYADEIAYTLAHQGD